MTYQEANALVDDFSFVYKGKSISKEVLIECREVIHKALEKQIPCKLYNFSLESYKGGCVPVCGKCNGIMDLMQGELNYCPNCGQKIDWSENNG